MLNDLFKKDGIEEVFSEELFLILSKIDKDEVPENHIGFYRYKINKTTEDIKKIKFNNKILHRSKLLKYFINENYCNMICFDSAISVRRQQYVIKLS